MRATTTTTTAIISLAAATAVVTHGFSNLPAFAGRQVQVRVQKQQQSIATTTTTTALPMGLFDGVKDAFSAPALERSTLDAERETPIDRWMGWSVARESDATPQQTKMPVDFVDAMDEANYVAVALTKPMGIVFEENDDDYGGIFIQSIKEGGAADQSGVLMEGDQLIAVGTKAVYGKPFDDALGTIVEATDEKVKLVFFRGGAKQFYGPTGASKDWLSSFVEKGGVEVMA